MIIISALNVYFIHQLKGLFMSLQVIITEVTDLNCQLLLSKNTQIEIRRLLAASKNTNQAVLGKLILDKDYTTSVSAGLNLEDRALLKQVLAKNPSKAGWLIRNSALQYCDYEEFLQSSDPSVRLAIHCNPNTPEEINREYLTPDLASDLCDRGGFLGMSVARAFILYHNNPWMANTSSNWSLSIKRAIASSRTLTEVKASEIRSGGWFNWRGFKNHPINQGLQLSKLTVEQLISLQIPAGDEEAISRAEVDLKNVTAILNRSKHQAEPYTIANIATLFGAKAIIGSPPIAGTRIKSAAWINPLVSFYDSFSKAEHSSVDFVLNTLGNSTDYWEMFLALLPETDLDINQVAELASKIN